MEVFSLIIRQFAFLLIWILLLLTVSSKSYDLYAVWIYIPKDSFFNFPKPINNIVILFHKWDTFCQLLLLKCSWHKCSFWFVFMGLNRCEANFVVLSTIVIIAGNMESNYKCLSVHSEVFNRAEACLCLIYPKKGWGFLEKLISAAKHIKKICRK